MFDSSVRMHTACFESVVTKIEFEQIKSVRFGFDLDFIIFFLELEPN